jgi:hypothetical protein
MPVYLFFDKLLFPLSEISFFSTKEMNFNLKLLSHFNYKLTMRNINLILFFVLCYCVTSAQSIRKQTNNTNAWLIYFGDHKISPKWGVHLEAQLRREDLFSNAQQLLLRPGINYHFSPQTFFSIGYAFVETYPYGDFPVKSKFPENRLWQQMQIKDQVGKFEMTTRFRLEQRWLKLPVQQDDVFLPGDAVYQNRFRLLARFSMPLKGKIIKEKSWYLSTYEEALISFGKHVGYNIFDQNRLYFALGYRMPKLGRLELGYLSQILNKSNGTQVENNNTLQIGLSSTLDFYKKRD